ncbi:MAG TPA: protein kinase, partial [Bacillota bacterium]|nr:protein kinase [Bacillota bacterium]
MNLTGQTFDNKYLVLELIGTGGMSLVYRALRIQNQTLVAVKLLKEKGTSSYPEDFLRFKREIEVMSSFKHPGVIEVYDTGEYQNRPYLVTELLVGYSLADLLKRGPGASGVDAAVEIVSQISQALRYVHQHGVIHRDLKPGNVFLLQGAQIRIKLLDFGIAHMIELGEIRDEAEIVGTFGYMAPEASGILNRRPDERSDLYSLGVIFYRLITGELPFQTTDINRLLHSQAALQPPRPNRVNPQIPLVLEEIVLKLLQKDPDLRYQSAQGLLNDLEQYQKGEREFQVGGRDQKIKLSYQTRLVGREVELAKLKSFVEGASRGAGKVCFIAGEPGVGKSRLMEEVWGYINERNGLFLRGRCLNHENKLPYQPFKDALDEYIKAVERLAGEVRFQEIQRLKNILGDLGAIVIQLNPRIERLIGKPKQLIPLEPERENQRFIMVLADFFCRLIPEQGLGSLFLDDLQWADEGSLTLLEELGTKIRRSNLLILGTYRDQEISPGDRLEMIRNRFTDQGGGFEEIKLAPFPRDILQQLLTLLMGETGAHEEILLNLIAKRSGGNPFFAIQIVRELVESKMVFWNGNHWETDSDCLRKMPATGSMVDLILKRINGLAERQKNLLSRAAVIGREFELELLYRLVKLDRACVVELVDQMIAMQLLEPSPERGRLLFAHDRIRDAFYQMLTVPERRVIHHEIAQAIESAHPTASELRVFELAHHYLESGELGRTDSVLEYTLLAADRAKAAYANEEALKYYQKGIELLERQGQKGSLRWLRANGSRLDVYLTIGRNDEAISMTEQFLRTCSPTMEKARVYYKIGKAYFNKGDWVRCEENLVRGLGFMGVRVPRGKAALSFSLVKELAVHFLPEKLRLFFSLRDSQVAVEREREILWAYVTLNYMYLLTDASKFFYNIMKMLNISEIRLKKSRELAVSLTGYAGIFMFLPRFKRALAYHGRALEMLTQLGDEWGIGYSSHYIGRTFSWMGMNSESISYYDTAMRNHQKAGDMWELGMEAQGLGTVYRYLSDYQKARECFEQYLSISRKIHDEFGLASACLGLGFVSVETGAWQQAREFLEQAISLSESKGIWFTNCCAISCLGYLELEQGNYEEAIRQLEKAKKINEANNFVKDSTLQLYPNLAEAVLKKYQATFLPGVRMTLQERHKMGALCKLALRKTKQWANHYGAALRGAACFNALIGKENLAKRYFLKGISHLQKTGQRYELAKLYFEYGFFWERRNRETEAKSYRVKAFELYTEIGAGGCLRKFNDFRAEELERKEFSEQATRMRTNSRDRLRVERRMNTVLATGRYLSSILDLDELLHKIIDHAMELVGAERGLLMLYPETGARMLQLIVNRNVGR